MSEHGADFYLRAAGIDPSRGQEPRATCPDCGRPITLQASGWWSHDGMPDGCWRLSMDGPDDEPDDDGC